MRASTWLDLSKLADGSRVVFTTSWDIYPECIVPQGTTGTVVENGLNELQAILLLAVDDEKVTEALRQWNGRVEFYKNTHFQDWDEQSPLALADPDPRTQAAKDDDAAKTWTVETAGNCQHRNDGRGRCIDCGEFLPSS